MGREQGLTDEKLRALTDFEGSKGIFTPHELAVLRYAEAMAGTPMDVTDEIFAAIRERYDDRQIVELTSAIAWEHYRARFDHALHIEAQGFSEGSFCPISPSAAE